MTPNTFFGYTLTGTFGSRRDGARPSATAAATSRHQGAQRDRLSVDGEQGRRARFDRGVGLLGGLLTWGPASIGAIDYYSQDMTQHLLCRGQVRRQLRRLASTPSARRSSSPRTAPAQNLLNGGTYCATNQFGVKVDLGYKTAILTVGYSVVNPGFAMQTPWSANPFYTDAQIQAFNRAGEQARHGRACPMSSTPLGLPGVARRCSITRAGPRPRPPARRCSRPNGTSISNGGRTGSHCRDSGCARATAPRRSDQGDGRTNIDEVRLILNYTIKLY